MNRYLFLANNICSAKAIMTCHIMGIYMSLNNIINNPRNIRAIIVTKIVFLKYLP